MINCPLCELFVNENAIHTKVWHRDETCMVINCDTCEGGDKIPMVVLKKHTMQLTVRELVLIIGKVRELFEENVTFRTDQRKIMDHFHWHIIRS